MSTTAESVRLFVKRMIDHHVQKNFLGTITGTSPIVVQLQGTGLSFSEDETLLLSHTVRKYDFEHGLAVGDVLLCVAAHGDKYVAASVVSENTNIGGIRAKGDDDSTAVDLGGQLVGLGTGTIDAGHITIDGTDYPVEGGTVTVSVEVPLVGKTTYYDAEGDPVGQVPIV